MKQSIRFFSCPSFCSLAVLSAIAALGLTACENRVVTPNPAPVERWVIEPTDMMAEEFGEWAQGGDLYDDECALVNLTNEIWTEGRELNSNRRVVYRSTLARGDIHQSVFYDPYLQYLIPGSALTTHFDTPVRYRDSLQVSVLYPPQVFFGDVPDSSFDLYFTNLNIRYADGTSLLRDYDTGAARDCHAVYNVILFNDLYPELINARVGAKSFPGVKIEEAKPRAKSGARMASSAGAPKVMAASTRFDLLEYAITEAAKGSSKGTEYRKFSGKAEFNAALKSDARSSDRNTRLGIARVMKIMKDIRQQTKEVASLMGSDWDKLVLMEKYSKLPKGLRTSLESLKAFSESLPKAE